MELSKTYTKKWAGFDSRYWLTIAVLILLAIASWAFRKKFMYSCPTRLIPMQGVYVNNGLVKQSFLINEPLIFSVPDVQHKRVVWFIDKKSVGTKDTLNHTFAQAGKYVVDLKIDDQCVYSVVVNILPYKHEAIDIRNTTTMALPDQVIEGNESFPAGSITYFTTPVIAQSYEWKIAEVPEYGVKTEQTVGYSIINPGVYTLQLKLNNDPTKTFTKTIKVMPPNVAGDMVPDMDVPKPVEFETTEKPGAAGDESKPVASGGAVAKPKNILPDDEILSILKLIRDDKKTLADLNESVCDGGNTKVLANDEKVMTLTELEERLKSKKWKLGKRPKVNSVRTVRDSNNGNCIKVIYVTYK